MSAYDRSVRLSATAGSEAWPGEPGRRPVLPAWALPTLAAIVLDVLAVTGTAWLLAGLRGGWSAGDPLVRIGGLAAAVVVLVGLGGRLYGRSALLAPPVAALLARWGSVLLFVLAPAVLVLPWGTLPAEGVVLFAMLSPVALLAGREALSLMLAAAFRRDWLARRSIVVLARSREEAEALARRLRRDPDCRATQPAALFECEPTDLAAADLVVVQAGAIRREDVAAALEALRALPGAAQFVAAAAPLERLRAGPDEAGGFAVFARKRSPLCQAERLAKRLLDVAIAGGALLLLAPLLLALALAMALRGRPVLVRRTMLDFEGRTVRIPAFARPAGPAEGASSWDALQDIPGLASVLAGQLSLVGPAPLPETPEEADLALARYAARQGLKPGLSRRPAEADATARRAADLAYCDQWSLGLDLSIMAGHLAGLVVDPSRPPPR